MVGLVVSTHAGLAAANGRFPRAERLKEVSADTLLLTGTYGLLVTTNRGQDWHFVCETVLFGAGAGGSWIDPFLELGRDGAIVSGTPHGVRVSRDLGCTFETAATLPADPTFFEHAELNVVGTTIDLTPLPGGADGDLVALTTWNDDQGAAVEHRLYATHDGALSWQQMGAPIPATLANPLFTIDVAPSDRSRIYVTGSAGDELILLRSLDGGGTWESLPLAFADAGDAKGAYLAAVSPLDADRLYVRIPRWVDDGEGGQSWDDSLLFSADGGLTFSDVLRRRSNLLGFALSPDGSTVMVGFGEPYAAPVTGDASTYGLYRASVADHVFEHVVSSLAVSCLTWTESGLYVCAAEEDPLGTSGDVDFHVGFTALAEPRRKNDFTTLLELKDIRGPIPWADDRFSACAWEWLSGEPDNPEPGSTCEPLNACRAGLVPLSPGALVCGGGTVGSGGGSGSSAGGGGGQAPAKKGDSGSCAWVPGNTARGSLILAFGLALGLAVRRCRQSGLASGCAGAAGSG